MKELILALMVWASANTGLDVPETMPIIKNVSAETMFYMVQPGQEYNPDRGVRWLALYANDVIYLQDTWQVDNLRDVSSLLHELVHHMQAYDADAEYRCRGKSEEVAYEAQMDWLTAAGVDPYETIGMNKLFYMMVIMCNPHE